MTNYEAEKALERAALALYEQGFDAVQIFGTWMAGGSTKCAKSGAGNWYARQGVAHEFINEDIARDNAAKLGEVLDKPDPGDSWKELA